MKALKGNIVHTPEFGKLETYEQHYIIEDQGKVVSITPELSSEYQGIEVIDYGDQLIIPSFVDIHLHAPQYGNIGMGLDLPLLPWLKTYTFPEEAKYHKESYAKKIYQQLLRDLYNFGTLRSCVFSSLHADGTIELMNIFDQAGLSAYIGKVNMDRNSNEEYVEVSAKESIADTLKVLDAFSSVSERIKPILTPRFIPTCTDELMIMIGKLAQSRDLAIQTHLNENLDEIEWVKELAPDSTGYLNAYERHGSLIPHRTILAHSIYNQDDELDIMADQQLYVGHCPSSNVNLMSGVAKVKQMIKRGIPVGLGSDIAAGDSLNMLDNMKDSIKASKLLSLYDGDESDVITFDEAFFLATRGGGSFFGNTGSFVPGATFDALIIDDSSYRINKLSLAERLEMLIYRGDDRQIVERYLDGNLLKVPFENK